MGKHIAVLMGAINLENQQKILDGMIDAIRETKDNVYVFTNYISARDNKAAVRTAFGIMELPDFKCFDGLIVVADTITYQPAQSYIMDKIHVSNVPTITINQQISGFGGLEASSYDAQYEIIEHLITVHDCKDIAFVRGPKGQKEADLRYQAYCDSLARHGIPYREEMVYEGNFALNGGMQAAVTMVESGIKPDAVVCANDQMAIGVIEVYKNVGYKVPEDIIVTGFDNSENAMYHNPTMSSVDKNPHEIGYRAIYELQRVMNGEQIGYYHINPNISLRESCGCGNQNEFDVEDLKRRHVQQHVYVSYMSEIVRNTMTELSGLQKPEEVYEVLKRFIKLTGVGSFYLCMCERDKVFVLPETNMGGNFDLLQVNEDYTDKIEMAVAYENGEYHSYKPFKKGMVLPAECRDSGEANFHVVTPVIFQNCCYGYCVSSNEKLPLKTGIFYSWLLNIGVAFENIRKWMLLQDAVVRLNNVWSYDMLTQLYNRAGFYYEAKTILEILKFQNSDIFILFADVDDLKKVNDEQGHELGDVFIREMATCIKENVSDDMLVMRYGGDEFVVFGAYEKESEIELLIQSIQASMDRRNKSGEFSFTISASMGVSTYKAQEVKDLNMLIEIADKKMYEQKRKKKEEQTKEGK